VLARAVVVVVALAAAVWLAWAYPGARDEARATQLLAQPAAQLSPAERAEGFRLLHSARRGRPDGPARLREAALLTGLGRRAEAAALLRPIVRREPQYLSAWTLLAFADPRYVPVARARQRELAPPVR
jgi:cytochrome c-type biogenesis protein CcmH/NrfG